MKWCNTAFIFPNKRATTLSRSHQRCNRNHTLTSVFFPACFFSYRSRARTGVCTRDWYISARRYGALSNEDLMAYVILRARRFLSNAWIETRARLRASVFLFAFVAKHTHTYTRGKRSSPRRTFSPPEVPTCRLATGSTHSRPRRPASRQSPFPA